MIRVGDSLDTASVSLATVELEPAGAGTRLIFTEQDAYLDGYDTAAQREQGTATLLDAPGAELRRQAAHLPPEGGSYAESRRYAERRKHTLSA